MNLPDEAVSIIAHSLWKNKLKEVVGYTTKLLKEKSIKPNEIQWIILINHLNEMIKREKLQERMEAVDYDLFSSVSKESLEIAEKVTQKVGNLEMSERYVLSIHFETARMNKEE